MSAAINAAMQPISPQSTDEELVAALQLNSGILSVAQSQAGAAFTRAKTGFQVPPYLLQKEWDDFSWQCNLIAREKHMDRSPAWWTANAELLRIALTAKEHFDSFANEWNRKSQPERDAYHLRVQQSQASATHQKNQTAIAAAAPPQAAFNPAILVSRYQSLGFSFAVDGDQLLISPKNKLSDDDRHIIRTNRTEIIAHLQASSEAF